MTKIDQHKWRKGPPPHIGWWAASISKDHAAWRWWDGVRWSRAAFTHQTAESAAWWAAQQEPQWDQGKVRWRHYYPAYARVPRIDPRNKS